MSDKFKNKGYLFVKGKLKIMEGFDLTKLDLFHIPDLKRMESCRIHSVLLFLYNKLQNDPKIALKYSELDNVMNYNLVHETIVKLKELNLIKIIQEPNKKLPLIVELKSNAELQTILNKDKKIEFERYITKKKLSIVDIKEAISCGSLNVHYDTAQIDSWLRNINEGMWDKGKFLMLAKLITFFKGDTLIKTATLNKRNGCKNKKPLKTTISEVFDRIPKERQEVIYRQVKNTVDHHKLETDMSFSDMAIKYLQNIGSLDN